MECCPNIRHLGALLEIARTGSISAASETMHLSQPAITQGLNRIESTLGTQVFERSASGMLKSTAGELFLLRVQRALNYLQAFTRDLDMAGRPWQQLFTTAQLRAIVAVVEHGNVSVAAAALGLAQPTVHRAAREAEVICGRPLFVRASGGVDPTPLARRLARLASQAFAEIRQGYDEVNQHQGKMTGQLRIGSLPLARTSLVPTSVIRLVQRFPDAGVSIVDGPYEQLLDMLLHGRIDMILGALRHPPPVRDVIQRKLFDDPLAVVVRAGHPLLQRAELDLKTIAMQDWVAPRQGTPARKLFHELFLGSGLEFPGHLIECSSSVATRALLLQSDRLALLSARQVEPELQAGLLATLPTPLNTSRPIGLTLRNNWQPTAMQADYLAILDDIAATA